MVCEIIRLIVLLIVFATQRTLGAGETASLSLPSVPPPQPSGPTQPGQPGTQQLANQVVPTQSNPLRVPQVQRPPKNINNRLTVSNLQPFLQAALAAAPSSPTPVKHPVEQVAAVPKATVPQAGEQVQLTAAPVNGHQSQVNDDPIVQIDYATIGDEVLRKQTANFVYFNANFNHCHNCDRFFSVWKELALDLRWWLTIVRLFVINCSDEDNFEVCRRAGATQFPQVRYYWVQSEELERDGQRLRILGKSIHAMRHIILDKVLESYAAHNKLLGQRKHHSQPGQRPPNNKAPLLTPLTPQGPSNQAPTNPLAPLLSPLIGQLLSGSPGKSSSPTPSATSGGLSAIMGLLSAGQGGSGGQGIGQLIGGLLSASSARRGLSIQPLPGNWPELQPIEASDMQQLLRTIALLDAGKALGTLLIMETQEFLYAGPEVMLDLSPYANQTDMVRVSDERSQLSKALTKRDDIQAPALIYLSASHEPRLILTAPKYTSDDDLRRAFVRAFERRHIKYPVKRVWTVPSGLKQLAAQQQQQLLGLSQEDEDTISRSDQLYMSDLTNAIRASLMEQVFRHADLSDDQYNALVKYVYALINYFPFNNDDSLKFCKRLHTWLQNQVSPMDVGEYKKQFHDIDEVLPARDWLACKSLSSTKAIPNKGKKSPALFENPSQLGKVVSNFTRLLRDQRQQANKLKSLFSLFASGAPPTMLGESSTGQVNGAKLSESPYVTESVGLSTSETNGTNGVKALAGYPDTVGSSTSSCGGDSPIERIIKSLTSGSLGSDSSILKLVSSALTGADGGDSTALGAGSKSKFAREYPCGAWKLAHVMVVNEYIKDSPRKDVKHIVLHSIYHYMLQFYACPTCGNRVSDVANEFRLNLNDHLVDQADSVILTWKMHNRISKRLESELRPGSPAKIQFPSESMCPKCRAPRTQNDLVSTPNWHDKQLLNFLVHHYRPQRIIASSPASSAAPAGSSPVAIGHFALLLGCLLMSGWLARDVGARGGQR